MSKLELLHDMLERNNGFLPYFVEPQSETDGYGRFADPRFITASEANKRDLWIRKGEHGVPLEHWSVKDGKPEVRMYTVFNVAQLSGDFSQIPKIDTSPIDLETA